VARCSATRTWTSRHRSASSSAWTRIGRARRCQARERGHRGRSIAMQFCDRRLQLRRRGERGRLRRTNQEPKEERRSFEGRSPASWPRYSPHLQSRAVRRSSFRWLLDSAPTAPVLGMQAAAPVGWWYRMRARSSSCPSWWRVGASERTSVRWRACRARPPFVCHGRQGARGPALCLRRLAVLRLLRGDGIPEVPLRSMKAGANPGVRRCDRGVTPACGFIVRSGRRYGDIPVAGRRTRTSTRPPACYGPPQPCRVRR